MSQSDDPARPKTSGTGAEDVTSRRRTRVSMRDVAQASGVSMTTVSLVLNQRPGLTIPKETQDRVMQCAAQLGYRPNAMARALRHGTSNLLGLITDEIATTPFAGQIVRGAQDVAARHGQVLALVNTDKQSMLDTEAIEVLLAHQVDAFVLATMGHRHIRVPELLKGRQVVLVNAFAGNDAVPCVTPDEVRGGREAVQHLLQAGHRRIGVIDNLMDDVAAPGRIQGYVEALSEAGLTADPRWRWHREGWQEAGYEGAMALLTQAERPTALFCLNDRCAMGAFDAARSLGLRVPDDVSIVGFDDQDVIAAHLRPGLDTMRLPHYEMGALGVEALLGQYPAGVTRLHCPLIQRGSVAPPPPI